MPKDKQFKLKESVSKRIKSALKVSKDTREKLKKAVLKRKIMKKK